MNTIYKKVPASGSNEYHTDIKIRSFTLRVKEDVINQVDEVVSKHPVMRSRNTWIVNAIIQQLKREGQG